MSNASSATGGEKGAGGVVFRKEGGRSFVGATCLYYPMGGDPSMLQLQACKRAVQLAGELNFAKLHIEMDCQEMVRKLQREENDL